MPTKVCKLCFKEIKDNSVRALIKPHLSLCFNCYKRLRPHFISFQIYKYKGLSLYYYDSDIRSLLYQFKGCYDYELKQIFFERYVNELRLKYLGYVMVPIPSYEEDDLKREFNHVVEMFSLLKIPIKKLIRKTSPFKQADHNKKERKEISKHLELIETKPLTHSKILLVDDVYTTGSTMKAAIKLLEKLKPKDIKVLVMAKTRNDKDYNDTY